MDRYILFGSEECYYASGGMHDFLIAHHSINALLQLLNEKEYKDIEWWHIYDTQKQGIIKGSESQPYGDGDLKKVKGCMIYTKEYEIGVMLSDQEIKAREAKKELDQAIKDSFAWLSYGDNK